MIIAALSTPLGRGALSVVRLSGAGSKEIARKIFSPFPEGPNLLKRGRLETEFFRDEAMCVYFDAPRSFTGEDTVEFHCHGGNAVAGAVLERCFGLGARPATNGEFSKRAFVNGKQNLSNAEGMIDLIEAESAGAARAGVMLMENRLGEMIRTVREALTDVIAGIEAALDYPEEELEGQTVAEQTVAVSRIKRQLDSLLKTVRLGGIVKNGAEAAIVGATNAGKSSLLNALAGEDRVIVSDIHGTTRDTVEVPTTYRDMKIVFVDTAGLRDTQDELEKNGIERAYRAAGRASVVLFVREGARSAAELARENARLGVDCPVLNVFSKSDLYNYDLSGLGDDCVAVSAKTGNNVETLMEKIYALFALSTENGFVITNLRHADCLRRATDALGAALDALVNGITLDCAASDVKQAWNALGEITGDTAGEEIIDRIYSRFCLGK